MGYHESVDSEQYDVIGTHRHGHIHDATEIPNINKNKFLLDSILTRCKNTVDRHSKKMDFVFRHANTTTLVTALGFVNIGLYLFIVIKTLII